MANYVKVVREYALAHYTEDGWDFVVECWADDEIDEVTKDARDDVDAVSLMFEEVKPLADYRDDIRATAW